MRTLPSVLFALGLLIGCGPPPSSGTDGGPSPDDADGDGISDLHEGRAEGTDTDGDGTPDYLDDDSDGDGIPDYREAGDLDLSTPPIDSDGDGTPDFRDLDSDNNGRSDTLDGIDDLDNDGVGNYADRDDDGDSIDDVIELGPDPLQPVDSDGDGTPDFQDTDSDDDTIEDLWEGAHDYDSDGIPNYLDLDSDGDCIPDELEARGAPPKDSDQDGRPDFLDRDSDNDGVLDIDEDANCNGVVDSGETNPLAEDSDGDGVSDLVETAAGTDPTNPADNPQANGDFVFIVPYMQPQSPASEDLDFSSALQAVDLYVMLDRSGSMTTEINTVKNNLSTVVRNVACPPLGMGTPGNCIPDLWAGAATLSYAGSGVQAFQNWVDIQPNPNFASLPTTEPTVGCCNEPLTYSALAAVTGQGGAAYGMSSVPARASCAGSPAANAGYQTFGYPCFRRGALPVVLLATDEPPLSGSAVHLNPNWDNVVKPAFLAEGARLVGVLGSAPFVNTDVELRKMATDTGAVDAMNGNAPLVFDGSNTNAAAAIQTGILRLANGLPLDLNATSEDDPSDSVDAIAAFVDRLETLQLGNAQCANGLTDVDSNGDSYPDKFLQVRTGTPVCWRVISKQNTTVPATPEPQLFRATVRVYGDGITQLDQRDVFFLVPPRPADGPIQ